MHAENFDKTTIGADFLKNPQQYPVDTLLDYLSGLMKLKAGNEHNEIWTAKYNNEINAVIYILKKQTA